MTDTDCPLCGGIVRGGSIDLLDEERLARAIVQGGRLGPEPRWPEAQDWELDPDDAFEWYASPNEMAAAIAKAYREDTDAAR